MPTVLNDIIEKFYKDYSGYVAKSPLDICTYCCMKPEDEALLASLPVRDIPKKLLMEYNDGARTEKTDIDEVKHFLPRYLELIAQFQFPSHSVELSLSRMVRFNEAEWTAEELDLLKQFSIEFFKKCLAVYPLPGFDRIDSILIMFWSAGLSVKELLSTWENVKTKESALHFRDLYFRGFHEHNRSQLASGFGDKTLPHILQDWIESENVYRNFTETIEQLIVQGNDLDDEDVEELNLLYDIIRSKKKVI